MYYTGKYNKKKRKEKKNTSFGLGYAAPFAVLDAYS